MQIRRREVSAAVGSAVGRLGSGLRPSRRQPTAGAAERPGFRSGGGKGVGRAPGAWQICGQARRRTKRPSFVPAPRPKSCRARMQDEYSADGDARLRRVGTIVQAKAESGHLFQCAGCRFQVMICSCCDLGQFWFPGECAARARRRTIRGAGQRYQRSPPWPAPACRPDGPLPGTAAESDATRFTPAAAALRPADAAVARRRRCVAG